MRHEHARAPGLSVAADLLRLQRAATSVSSTCTGEPERAGGRGPQRPSCSASNKRIFQELVISVDHLGLKKLITVAERADGSGYGLVCGQGRLEGSCRGGTTKVR
jgi:hypothetical protein